MKSNLLFLAPLLCLFAFAGDGCAGVPNRLESGLFNIKTNYYTNPAPFMEITGEGTNRVTNIVTKTVVTQGFDFTPRPDIEAVIQAGGTVASATGAPWAGLIAPVLIGALGLYAQFRSSKKDKTAQVFAQGIQIFKEVVKATPGGEKLADDTMTILKAQQKTAGIKPVADAIVDKGVDKDLAKATASLVTRPDSPPRSSSTLPGPGRDI